MEKFEKKHAVLEKESTGLTAEQEDFLFADQGLIPQDENPDNAWQVWFQKYTYACQWLGSFCSADEFPDEYARHNDRLEGIRTLVRDFGGRDMPTIYDKMGIVPNPIALCITDEVRGSLPGGELMARTSAAINKAIRELGDDPLGGEKVRYVSELIKEAINESKSYGVQGSWVEANFPDPVAGYSGVFPAQAIDSQSPMLF